MTDRTKRLAAFDNQQYLNLETFRKNGIGIRTPVWFAADPGATITNLYVYTTADAGKTKRIRANGAVRIAPCNSRGTLTGAWIDANATIVSGDAFNHGMQLLNRKYWLMKRILDVSARLFRRRERVVFSIRPI